MFYNLCRGYILCLSSGLFEIRRCSYELLIVIMYLVLWLSQELLAKELVVAISQYQDVDLRQNTLRICRPRMVVPSGDAVDYILRNIDGRTDVKQLAI